MSDLYFEDFTVGRRFESLALTLSEDAILDFAQRFDPQPFHIDVEAARRTPFQGLIASGIHTLAVTFYLFLQTRALAASSLGSPGLDEVRWLRPVRPGDTLRAVVEVASSKPSTSKPDRGVVTLHYQAVNQHGETVMTMTGHQLIRRHNVTGP